jgi:hypothetical protein
MMDPALREKRHESSVSLNGILNVNAIALATLGIALGIYPSYVSSLFVSKPILADSKDANQQMTFYQVSFLEVFIDPTSMFALKGWVPWILGMAAISFMIQQTEHVEPKKVFPSPEFHSPPHTHPSSFPSSVDHPQVHGLGLGVNDEALPVRHYAQQSAVLDDGQQLGMAHPPSLLTKNLTLTAFFLHSFSWRSPSASASVL